MNPQSPATEAVVRHHLTAFLERRGVDAIVADYSEAAHFHTEAEMYVGKQEIHGFFEHFIEALPAGGIDRFELRSLHVEGDLAYITWNVGTRHPPGHRHLRRGRREDRRPDVRHVRPAVRPAGPSGLTSAVHRAGPG